MEYCANYTEFLRDMSIALTSAVSMLEQNRHLSRPATWPPCLIERAANKYVMYETRFGGHNLIW